MPTRKPAKSRARLPLSRERVVQAALTLVDEGGVAALSMRTVAAKLGVEAMSLYRHVSSKEDLLSGIADLVLSQIVVPAPGTPWRAAMRERAVSAREVFLRHPSAAIVVESFASLSPSRLVYTDTILSLLMADGFDATLAYRAFLTLDSYIYGFTMQELSWPRPASSREAPNPVVVPAERFPHLAEVVSVVLAHQAERGLVQSYADEFSFGLELMLDALERLRSTAAPSKRRRS
jgi:AcrR family transcriptional regulator